MESKFEFWGDLPNEMRAECIKRMDFKTRMRLRGASKQDKLLVESAPKYQFGSVSFLVTEGECSYFPHGNVSDVDALIRISKAIPEWTERNYQLAAQVIKFAATETVDVGTNADNFAEFSKFLIDISTPFNFKSIMMRCHGFQILEYFLKNDMNLKYVDVDCSCYSERNMLDFVTFPSVIKAEIVVLDGLRTAEIPYQLIKNWIEKENLKVGKIIYLETVDFETFNILTERFASRKISNDSNPWMLIRTDDPTKAIQFGLHQHEPNDFTEMAARICVFDLSNRNYHSRHRLDLGDVAAALPHF